MYVIQRPQQRRDTKVQTKENFEVEDIKKPYNFFLIVVLVVTCLVITQIVWVLVSRHSPMQKWLGSSPSLLSPPRIDGGRISFKYF